MISFTFKINKSFLQNPSHPITIPKSSVDYKIINAMDKALTDSVIVCPDSTKIKGRIYSGMAGYGPYFQIQMQGYSRDPLFQLEKKELLLVQIQNTDNKTIIFLTVKGNISNQIGSAFTSKYDESEKALIEGAVTRIQVNRFERDNRARDICIKH